MHRGVLIAAAILAGTLPFVFLNAPHSFSQTTNQVAPAVGDLVIEGGTLIDGTGRPPIGNAVIIIENGRFKAVGKMGAIAIPPGSRIVDVKGKTILPGLIDGHCHLEDFYGELYLHLGITTCATIEIFQDGPWTKAQRDGTNLGKIRGPRIWTSGRALGAREGQLDTPNSRAFRGNIVVTTPDEARAAVDLKKKRGYDLIKINEFVPLNLVKAITDEAHRLNMAVTAHSWDAIGDSINGVDGIEHIWSVGYSSISDVAMRRSMAMDRLAGKIDAEEVGYYYEPENFDAVIKAMVDHHVAWTPTIAKWYRPLSPNAKRFQAKEEEILNDPNTDFPDAMRVITEDAYTKLFKRYTPQQLERTKVGYGYTQDFIRRFVKAGGILKEGSDSPRGMAGLLMHEGMAMDVEAGVDPMTVIQAATLNVAKTYKKDKDYGSVEPGKVADLSIIEGDPLKDIWMTQNVKMAVLNGKITDIGFHKYKNPIPSFYSWQTLPREITIAPVAISQGAAPAKLAVMGVGFWPFHRVMLNGKELETHYVNKKELDAVIPAAIAAKPGLYLITVHSRGESVSTTNPQPFLVTFK